MLTGTTVAPQQPSTQSQHCGVLLSSSVPQLQPHCAVLEIHRLGEKVYSDGGLIPCVKRIVHEPCDDGRLSYALVPQKHQLVLRQWSHLHQSSIASCAGGGRSGRLHRIAFLWRAHCKVSSSLRTRNNRLLRKTCVLLSTWWGAGLCVWSPHNSVRHLSHTCLAVDPQQTLGSTNIIKSRNSNKNGFGTQSFLVKVL